MKNNERIAMPSEKQVKDLVERITRISRDLERYTVSLGPGGKQHLLKPRRGAEKVSELIAQVANERKVELPGVSTVQIVANQARAKRYAPLYAATSTLTRSLRDTIFDAESKAWWTTTAFYTALQGLSRTDATLQNALQPAKSFFALGRRKPKVVAAK
jgi:uncharacterized protein (DUF885 family)